MTICRYYLMTAAEGQSEALRGALVALAAKVRPIAGCEGVELYQDEKRPERLHFLEHWTSIDAHRAGGAALGKEALAPVMELLAGPPEGAYIAPVPLG